MPVIIDTKTPYAPEELVALIVGALVVVPEQGYPYCAGCKAEYTKNSTQSCDSCRTRFTYVVTAYEPDSDEAARAEDTATLHERLPGLKHIGWVHLTEHRPDVEEIFPLEAH